MASASELYRQLDTEGKRRYREKMEDLLHVDVDPYVTAKELWTDSPESWPDISFPDIYTYLINSPSP